MVIPSVFQPISPDFLHPQIKSSWKQLYRYENLDSRYYFEWDDDGNKSVYISVTSLASAVIPMGYNYSLWLMNTGKQAMVEKNEKTVFGSLFHREAMKPLHGKDEIHGKGYNFSFLDDLVPGEFYIDEEGNKTQCSQFHCMIPPEWRWKANAWRYSFKRGLLSWFHFLNERVSYVLAVEYPARSKTRNVACTLDLVHGATFHGKERLCITDVKSFLFGDTDGKRKNFYDAHEFQLEVCKDVWNEEHGELHEVTHVFNWSPTAWKKDPKDWGEKYHPYTWQNQTSNKYSEQKMFGGVKMKTSDILIAYANVTGLINPPTTVSDIQGGFDEISDFKATDHVKKFDLFNIKTV